MPPALDGFTVRETHGILARPGVRVLASSDNRGWHSLYASAQRETPFEAACDAVDDQLIVLHLDGLVPVHRRVAKGEVSRLIPAGGLFMMPGGLDFGVRVAGTLNTLHLYLRRALLQEVAGDMLIGDPARVEILPLFGERDPLIERLMLGVRDALGDANPSATPFVDYLTRAIAARLIHRHSSAPRFQRHGETRARVPIGQLSRAIDFMEANLQHSIGLPAIAAATCLSPSHFARQFGAIVGRAPHQYLMQLRIERAERLLRETETSLVDIALACGFANQEHMTRLFKRSKGTTPAAYRKAVGRWR
ncbi:MAG TPA: AraC family transcriptional regulator [Acetobacteraceae bacterium]